MLDTITFDQLPKAVGDILDGIAEIKDICKELRGDNAAKDEFLTIEQLQAYHPDHPSLQTVHRWKSLGYIPFYKDPATRRVKFKKSEIDAWIASSRHIVNGHFSFRRLTRFSPKQVKDIYARVGQIALDCLDTKGGWHRFPTLCFQSPHLVVLIIAITHPLALLGRWLVNLKRKLKP